MSHHYAMCGLIFLLRKRESKCRTCCIACNALHSKNAQHDFNHVVIIISISVLFNLLDNLQLIYFTSPDRQQKNLFAKK